jgi:hypothetical protein
MRRPEPVTRKRRKGVRRKFGGRESGGVTVSTFTRQFTGPNYRVSPALVTGVKSGLTRRRSV